MLFLRIGFHFFPNSIECVTKKLPLLVGLGRQPTPTIRYENVKNNHLFSHSKFDVRNFHRQTTPIA